MLRDIKKQEEEQSGSPAWMTTYGDMVTLLLVFFVLLYSFSVMDLEKFRGFISALKNQLGVLSGGTTISDQSMINKGSAGQEYNPSKMVLERVMRELQQYIRDHGLEQFVKLEMSKRGLVVRLTGQVLYELGKATIRAEGKEMLGAIAASIINIDNHVTVEGHTDNWPIKTERFPSNWELSTARATNVVRYFIEEHSIDPARLSAAGYSEYKPLLPNDTDEHRAQNRRIEVVILNTKEVNPGG